MSSSEINGIKLNLIDWINQLSDKNVIAFLEALRISNSKQDDWWNELSEVHKNEIQLGIKDADNGQLVESKDFWKTIKNVGK